jgi:midasin
MFELYVPDVPIDPLAIQTVVSETLQLEAADLSSQIKLHMDLEQCDTGDSSNTVLGYLQNRFRDVSTSLDELRQVAVVRATDASTVHSFWAEITHFLGQAISSSRIEPLLRGLESGDAAAGFQERVLQETISAFCQRLESVYPQYEDLVFPLQLSLLSARLGIRLVAAASPNVGDEDVRPLATSLVAFPSVRCASRLLANLPSALSGVTALSQLITMLAAVGFEKSLGVPIEFHLDQLGTIYEQAARLWLIDRAKEEDTAQASHSLYRRRMDHADAGDAAKEQEEFLELFPNFDQDNASHNASSSGEAAPSLADTSQAQQLLDLHLFIFDETGHTPPHRCHPAIVFLGLRREMMMNVLSAHYEILPDVLDIESRHFQISILHDRLVELQSEKNPRIANFYTDPNISRVKQAASVVTTLKTRLETLIDEWPDQMVLQRLREYCDFILQLDVRSPVAKVLSALEQLLLQTEDWEIFANRDNTLKAHQQTLINLIVEWRRLELSCWHGLLQSHAQAFSDGASEWWFRLYDAIVRGVLDASARKVIEDSDPLTSYLEKLLPLLDEFVYACPLGQFHARLALLRSFENYVRRRVLQGSTEVASLRRVLCILHSTVNFYNLFSAPLHEHLSAQRRELEKETQALIKLASWKDVNVQALKQSAQRTHHQLYKIVRKFRDILRQPIRERLRPDPAGSSETSPLPEMDDAFPTVSLSPSSIFPDHVSFIPSEHVRDLQRAYGKFVILITERIQPFLTSQADHSVDSLATQTIVTTRALSQESVVATSVEKRQKQAKALLVRKRKAWSDLLKELKQGGLSANVRPEVLKHQSDALWIREQPAMPPNACLRASPERGEIYFHRLCGLMPLLRSQIFTHHPDLSARELERGTMYLQSCFSIALQARTRYVVRRDLMIL